MAEEKKWKESEGPGTPEGNGGTSSPDASTDNEVAGRSRQMVVACVKCGTQSYVGGDWKWFTCWKCGGMSTEMVA